MGPRLDEHIQYTLLCGEYIIFMWEIKRATECLLPILQGLPDIACTVSGNADQGNTHNKLPLAIFAARKMHAIRAKQ